MKFSVPLKFNYEFSRVYRRGKYLSDRHVVLHYVITSKPLNRIGVTTSKNIGGSVQRNRMRRLLRESYRLSELKLKKGYDIILLGRMLNPEVNYNVISREVLRLMKKAGIIAENKTPKADCISPAKDSISQKEDCIKQKEDCIPQNV